MGLLTYTNRLKLVIDIIFNPKKVEGIIENENKSLTKELVRGFNEKLSMIEYDQYKKGIVLGPDRNSIVITKINRLGINAQTEDVCAKIEHRKIDKLRVQYEGLTSSEISSDYLKENVAIILARKLVKEGFIQTKVNPNEVEFYINAYQ